MASKAELDSVYMGTAFLHSRLSRAKRLQVGACIVTAHGTTLTGYNGTPPGWNNQCEDENNITKPDVIHAESNAILKAAREGVSVLGATLYVTHSPCLPCAAKIASAGITRVVYNLWYRDDSGIKALQSSQITVEQLPMLTINRPTDS
jgi:dCMP deaminase